MINKKNMKRFKWFRFNTLAKFHYYDLLWLFTMFLFKMIKGNIFNVLYLPIPSLCNHTPYVAKNTYFICIASLKFFYWKIEWLFSHLCIDPVTVMQPPITLLDITAKIIIRQLCNFHIISIWPQRNKRTTLLLLFPSFSVDLSCLIFHLKQLV